MNIILMINIKLISILLAILSILGVGYSAYSYTYNQGKLEAQVECQKKFEEYQKQLDEKISRIETSISSVAESSQTSQQLLNSDITEILKRVKKAPVTVVKDGKCYPSQTFVDGINEAINRANKK